MFDTAVAESLDQPRPGEQVDADTVRHLPRLAAGAGLHAVLEMADVDDPSVVDDAGLLEVVAGTERAIAALHALQARALAELDARRVAEQRAAMAAAPVGRAPLGRFTGEEVAARLGWAPAAADTRVDESVRLARDLPCTLRLLALGEIDRSRAVVVVRGTAGLDAAQARAVDAEVAERAAGMTRARLRRVVAAAAVAVDPADAQVRAQRAAAGTSVDVVAEDDAMATLSAHAPAAEVVEVMAALDAGADAARAAGATGRPGLLRWTVLLDWARGRNTGCLTGALGAAGSPGPATAGPATAGPATADPAAADPARDSRRGRAAVQVNVAATTLIGLDDAPAELLGYGPIPADVARRLAADATWRRVLIDPATGIAAAVDPRRLPPGETPVVDAPAPDPPAPEPLSRDGCDGPTHPPGDYRPGVALTRLVSLRHPRCCAPGCSRAAATCDLDHVVPYPHGPTCACNLRPLCRRHHRMKHETAWTYRVLPGGAVRWTTPTGSEHDVEPEPLLPRARVAPVPRDLGPPPF